MSPETVISTRNPKASREVVKERPDGRLQVQRNPDGLNQTVEGQANDKEDIEPVDVLVPVLSGNGIFGDVLLAGIVGF